MNNLQILTLLVLSIIAICGTTFTPSYQDNEKVLPELISNSIYISGKQNKFGLSYKYEAISNTLTKTAKDEDENADSSKLTADIDVYFNNKDDSENIEAYAVYKELKIKRLEIFEDMPEYKDISQFIFYALIDKQTGEIKEFKVPVALEEDAMLLVITKNFFNSISPDLRSAKYQDTANNDAQFSEEDNLGQFIPKVQYSSDESTVYINKVISEENYISKKIQEAEFPQILQVRSLEIDKSSGIVTKIQEILDFSMSSQVQVTQEFTSEQGEYPGYDSNEEILGNVTGHMEYTGLFLGIIENCEEFMNEIEEISKKILVNFNYHQLNTGTTPDINDEPSFEDVNYDEQVDQTDENTVQKLQQTPIYYNKIVFFNKKVLNRQLSLEGVLDLKSSYFDYNLGLLVNNKQVWTILHIHQELCRNYSQNYSKSFAKTLFHAQFFIGFIPVHFALDFKITFGVKIQTDPNCKVSFIPYVLPLITANAGIGFKGIISAGIRIEGYICNTSLPLTITPFAQQQIKNVQIKLEVKFVAVRFVFGVYYEIKLIIIKKKGFKKIYEVQSPAMTKVLFDKVVRLW